MAGAMGTVVRWCCRSLLVGGSAHGWLCAPRACSVAGGGWLARGLTAHGWPPWRWRAGRGGMLGVGRARGWGQTCAAGRWVPAALRLVDGRGERPKRWSVQTLGFRCHTLCCPRAAAPLAAVARCGQSSPRRMPRGARRGPPHSHSAGSPDAAPPPARLVKRAPDARRRCFQSVSRWVHAGTTPATALPRARPRAGDAVLEPHPQRPSPPARARAHPPRAAGASSAHACCRRRLSARACRP